VNDAWRVALAEGRSLQGSDSQYPGYIFANPESAAEAYRCGLLMLAQAK
jgi:hypothetical protein